MDESAALEVVAARAVETGDRDRLLWTDADRDWASRAAAQVVGEGASAEAFLTRRARLVLERIGPRQPAVSRMVRALRWRPWVGAVVVAAAFLLGLVIDRIGGGSSINLLAPPVFLLLVWNVLVYIALLVRIAAFRGRPGPLRSLLIELAALRTPAGARAGVRARARARDGEVGTARRTILETLPGEWASVAAPLYGARAARVLHLAAAAAALGVIAGLYLRGLAFEYRATWESTFLDAEQVRGLLAVTLAPGSWLTGIPIPDVSDVAAIRAPDSENAATWMHLLAGSVAAVVVIPRLVLALVAGLVERRRAARVDVPIGDPATQRLIAGYLGRTGRVRLVPYSYTVTPEIRNGLDAILARAYGGASVTVEAPVAWGDDEALADLSFARLGAADEIVLPLFGLAATPERQVHGAFLEALGSGAGAGAGTRAGSGAGAGSGHPLTALVDESGFRARWPDDDERLEGRRAAWRELLAAHGGTPVFVDLASPDVSAAEAELAASALDAGDGADRGAPRGRAR